MKRVCLDARMICSTGIGTYIQNILKGWDPSLLKLHLIIPPGAMDRFPFLENYSHTFSNVGIYSLREQFVLPKIVPRCDIFWSPHYNVPLLPVRSKKRVVTIHDVFHLAFQDSLGWKERLYARRVLKHAVGMSHRILTVSEFSKSEIQHYLEVSDEKIDVIPIGVDREHFKPSKDESYLESLRERYHLPERYFLFVGSLKPHKNLQGLLEAFAHLVEEGLDNCPLVLVGRKDGLRTKESLGAIFQKFPYLHQFVIQAGEVPYEDLPGLYQMATSFFFPSFYEGFGLPPLEAMSCGCPVAASHSASLKEVCGDAVYVLDPQSPSQMAHAMRELLGSEELRQSLRQKGSAHLQKFSWKGAVEKHLSLLGSL